jgi:6-phospho-3-hexuloisomerase
MTIRSNFKIIKSEIESVFDKIVEREAVGLIAAILKARRIVCCGAGRVGMATKAFSMRLKHLGFESYFLGDSNVPSIGRRDLLVVSSGSGETQTIYDVVKIAKDYCTRTALITGNPESRMGKIADIIVQIKAPSKIDLPDKFKSRQPMATLNEQCLWIFFDALVLEIMKKKKISEKSMHARHSILE